MTSIIRLLTSSAAWAKRSPDCAGVSVNEDYSVSQVIYWLDGATRALNTPISVVIRIARENDPDSTLFQEPSDDTLGECEAPGSTLVEGIDVSALPQLVSSSGVFTPSGSMLNPVYSRPVEPIVQIGARPSATIETGRAADPGLIFAECANVAGADPGILYDTDEIRVFWSWYRQDRRTGAAPHQHGAVFGDAQLSRHSGRA